MYALHAQTFAALRAIVGKTSRAIATRSDSARARACAVGVTAAVVYLASVDKLECSAFAGVRLEIVFVRMVLGPVSELEPGVSKVSVEQIVICSVLLRPFLEG